MEGQESPHQKFEAVQGNDSVQKVDMLGWDTSSGSDRMGEKRQVVADTSLVPSFGKRVVGAERRAEIDTMVLQRAVHIPVETEVDRRPAVEDSLLQEV